MSGLLVAFGAGFLLMAVAALVKSFALPIAAWCVRGWLWLLTLGMPTEMKSTRRAEVASDLWEHEQDARSSGYAPYEIALQIVLRLLMGMPADASWRLRHMSGGYAPLAVIVALTAGGLVIAWDGDLGLTVVRVTVVTAAVTLLIAIAVTRERVARLPGGVRSMMRRQELSGLPDYQLLVAVVLLVLVGVLSVYITGSAVGYLAYGDANHFILRQGVYAIVGLAALVCFMRLDYHQLRYLAVPMMVLALLGLLAVLAPGIGTERNGARRWLELGPITFQPSEFAKLAIIIYISAWLSGRRENVNRLSLGLAPFVLMVSTVGGLVMVEPDMGTAVIIVLTMSTLFFVAGAPPSHLALLMISGGLVNYFMILGQYYWFEQRITSFLSPDSDPLGTGYQTLQLVGAIHSGGLTGQGLGSADALALLLPGAHAGSIFAVVAYSVGFVGVAVLIALFCLFVSRGLCVALHAGDRFGALLALGVTCCIGYQALFNIAGVARLAPLTGVDLPLISYGGTSIVAVMAAVGVLLSVSRHRQQLPRRDPAPA